MQDLRRGIVKALAATNTTSRDIWKAFWSAQQRFFKLLCVSMKVCNPLLPSLGAAMRSIVYCCVVLQGEHHARDTIADSPTMVLGSFLLALYFYSMESSCGRLKTRSPQITSLMSLQIIHYPPRPDLFRFGVRKNL